MVKNRENLQPNTNQVLIYFNDIFGNHCSLYESRNVWVYTNRSGVYMRQVSTRARYGRTANESRSEAGMPLLDESSHRRVRARD